MQRLALAACLVLVIAGARADEPESSPVVRLRPLDQMIYKGVAGNLLDTMPIEPDARVNLQRANAVISNPVSWRSVGLLMGVANPVFLVGGLIWGIWSAANIEPAKPDTSWLGFRLERIGFCNRPLQESCRLHLPHENGPEHDPRVMHTAVVIPN